ncbi:MAG: RAD55 family ATPase [Candidatus Heimdallarchaeaceae archaeon]
MFTNTSGISEKKLFSFGIPSLDEILGGGIPAGANVLIEDEIGAEADPFILHFLAEGLKAGEYGYIFSTEHPYEYYKEMMTGIGVNTEMLEATGRLKFIDAFSNPFGYTDVKSSHQNTVHNLSQPREINETIRRSFLHVQNQQILKRGIFVSLSSIIYAADESKKIIFSFLQNRLAANKREGAVTLFALHHDAHDPILVRAIEHNCDVTLRITKSSMKAERPITEARVINVKGKPELAGEPIKFEFISGKIIPYYDEEVF